MYKGSNCDRKSQLSGILTEPLNPRGLYATYIEYIDIYTNVLFYYIDVFLFENRLFSFSSLQK